jgi:hypothetical protein
MTLTDIISKIILYAKRAIVNDNSSNTAVSINQAGSGTAVSVQASLTSPAAGGILEVFKSSGGDFVYDGGGDGVFVFSNISSSITKATAFTGANVGIGTAIPTATLDVNGSIKGHFAEFNNPTGDTKVEIGGTGAVYLDLKKPNTDDYDLRIGVDSGIASIQTPIGQSLEINAIGGNVGIGASVPARKLHVNGLVRLQGLPTYTSNAAAIAGGLAVGDIYFDVVSGQGELRVVI